MYNFFLSSIAYSRATPTEIENNLILLNEIMIEQRGEDRFMKNESIWDYPTAEGIFGEIIFTKFADFQFSSNVVPRLLESIQNIDYDFKSLGEFDDNYKNLFNSFYGANFGNNNCNRHIDSIEKYDQFKIDMRSKLTPSTFWEWRNFLFANIIFCSDVEQMLQTIGGTYLGQILDQLRVLDDYVGQHWIKGEFSYKGANASTPLSISPESAQTMGQEKYRNQRNFTLPDGRQECFELHIKTGKLRFHFYPEGFKIYIGYIGSHLDTHKF